MGIGLLFMSDKEYPEPSKPETCGGNFCNEEHGHIDCKPELFTQQVSTLASMCVDFLGGGLTKETFLSNLKMIVKYLEKHK